MAPGVGEKAARKDKEELGSVGPGQAALEALLHAWTKADDVVACHKCRYIHQLVFEHLCRCT